MNLTLATIGIVGIIMVALFLIFKSDTYKATDFELSKNNTLDPMLAKIMNSVGGDVLGIVSENRVKKQTNNKLAKLFRESGNPWNLNYVEFNLLRFVLMIGGMIVDFLFSVVIFTILDFSAFSIFLVSAFSIVLIVGGYFYPVIYYNSVAQDRVASFKTGLPEAIDYLIMALSGGGFALPKAFEMAVRYLPPGVIREEFERIISDLKIGKTMEAALNDFEKRVPTEGIRAFVKALNNANKLSVSMIDILENRAKASRAEREAEIELKIQKLPTKVMAILMPASLFSIMAVALAPAIAVLAQFFL